MQMQIQTRKKGGRPRKHFQFHHLHVLVHENLWDQLNAYCREFMTTKQDVTICALENFLETWLNPAAAQRNNNQQSRYTRFVNYILQRAILYAIEGKALVLGKRDLMQYLVAAGYKAHESTLERQLAQMEFEGICIRLLKYTIKIIAKPRHYQKYLGPMYQQYRNKLEAAIKKAQKQTEESIELTEGQIKAVEEQVS